MPTDGGETVSYDALLNGGFRLWQPVRGALRASHDALLAACAVERSAGGQLIDMGAGTGAVGFASALRAPGLRVRMTERDAGLCALLRRSVDDAPDALRHRLSVAELDLLAPRPSREAAGVPDGAFDWVATNPPFHSSEGRASPDPRRAAALAMPQADFLVRWMHVAAALLRQDGRLVLVTRPETAGAIIRGAENRFGALSLLPVHTRPGPATRLLVGAVRGSRAPLRFLPSYRLDETARRDLSAGSDTPPLFG